MASRLIKYEKHKLSFYRQFISVLDLVFTLSNLEVQFQKHAIQTLSFNCQGLTFITLNFGTCWRLGVMS